MIRQNTAKKTYKIKYHVPPPKKKQNVRTRKISLSNKRNRHTGHNHIIFISEIVSIECLSIHYMNMNRAQT